MGKSAGHLCSPSPAPLTTVTPNHGHSLEHLQNHQLSKSFVAAQHEDQCFPCQLHSILLPWPGTKLGMRGFNLSPQELLC